MRVEMLVSVERAVGALCDRWVLVSTRFVETRYSGVYATRIICDGKDQRNTPRMREQRRKEQDRVKRVSLSLTVADIKLQASGRSLYQDMTFTALRRSNRRNRTL